MKNAEIEKEILARMAEMKPTAFFCMLKKNAGYMEDIRRNTPALPDSFSLRTRLYWYLNGLDDFPKCSVCGSPIIKEITNMRDGYQRTCSKKCSFADKERSMNISARLNARTDEEKHATLEKTKATCLEKYGVEHSFQSDNNKTKSLATCLEKYGVDNPMKAKNVRALAAEHNFAKYGVSNVAQTDYVKMKIRDTCMRRYGAEYPMQNAEIREAASMKIAESRREKSWNDNIVSCPYDKPLFTHDFYIQNYSRDYEFEFKCTKCGNRFKSKHYEGYHDRCPKCYPRTASVSERDIADCVRSFYSGNIVLNTKRVISPLELDIYVPDRKFAIEYDGLYWHAFENTQKTHGNKNYHLGKTEMCEKLGIQLVHVFEDEWKNKRGIVESRLRDMFGVYENTVFARKCHISEVSDSVASGFLEKNHLQGNAKASVRIGLFCGDYLISLMTFSKCRFDRKHEWEMVRFCNRLGYHVPGAAGRLLKYFEKTYVPRSLVTYADRRWSVGKLYKSLGFDFVGNSPPAYWYIPARSGHTVRLNRMLFQKHTLKDRLPVFDEKLTEYQNMRANGFETIYDCGNMVFEKTYS